MTSPDARAREILLEMKRAFGIRNVEILAAHLRAYGDEEFKRGTEYQADQQRASEHLQFLVKRASADGFRRGMAEGKEMAVKDMIEANHRGQEGR